MGKNCDEGKNISIKCIHTKIVLKEFWDSQKNAKVNI